MIRKGQVIVPVRIPCEIYRAVRARVQSEDLDFSKYVRRAIRRDLERAGIIPARLLNSRL